MNLKQYCKMGYTNKREWNSKYSRPTIESATNRATIRCNKCNELKVRDRNEDITHHTTSFFVETNLQVLSTPPASFDGQFPSGSPVPEHAVSVCSALT